MTDNILTLAPGQKQLDQSIGFAARSVGVTNYTGSFVRLDDSPPDIPPWAYGVVRALPPGTRQARARLVSVTPAAPGPPVPLSQATLTWSDMELPPSPGQLLVAQAVPPTNVQGPTQIAAGQSLTFNIPPGAVYATLLIPGSSTGSTIYTLTGNVSGQYLSETIPATGQFPPSVPRLIRLDAADTSLVVADSVNSTGTTTVTVDFHTDSSGPANRAAANDRYWQCHTSVNGAGTLSVNSNQQQPLMTNARTVLDYAVFTVHTPGTNRIFTPQVSDGGVGGTVIGESVFGNGGSTDTITPAPVVFQGLKSSIGQLLGFDLQFALLAGERAACTAVGHFE